jgi:hypothetical protein
MWTVKHPKGHSERMEYAPDICWACFNMGSIAAHVGLWIAQIMTKHVLSERTQPLS